MATPNWQSDTGTIPGEFRINTLLSTQIIIQVDGVAVGAVQELSPRENRGLARVAEIGTDGIVEIVPNRPTEITLNVNRLAFDNIRLPEAFRRGFQHIAAQRIPFDIHVIQKDGSGSGQNQTTVYHNCWLANYSSPYRVNDWQVVETAEIWPESVYNFNPVYGGTRGITHITSSDEIERKVDIGTHTTPGSMDAAGLLDLASTEF